MEKDKEFLRKGSQMIARSIGLLYPPTKKLLRLKNKNH